MLDIQAIANYVQEYGVVDFDCEMDDGVLWFRGVNCYLIIGKVTDKQVFLTVWEDDECNEVIENFEIQNLDELNVCLKKYALIAQAGTKQDETIQKPTDTTMIDIYFKLIKDKLAEHQINLDFDKQSQAEKLVIRDIEDKLVEVIKFLQ